MSRRGAVRKYDGYWYAAVTPIPMTGNELAWRWARMAYPVVWSFASWREAYDYAHTNTPIPVKVK